MIDINKLNRLLQTIGKSTFKNCYDVVEKNYMKENKSNIDEAIEKYGLKITGRPYKKNSIVAKRNAAIRIFKLGWQKEALKEC